MFNAGNHTPVMPLVDVAGSGLKVSPLQMGATALNVGVVGLFTVIVRFVVVAH